MHSNYKSFSVGERVKVKNFLSRNTGIVIETQDPIYDHGIMISGQYIKVKWDNPNFGETDWLPANQFTEA